MGESASPLNIDHQYPQTDLKDGKVVEVLTPAIMEMVFHVRAEVDLDPRTKAYNITILEHLPRDVDRTRNDS